jgi:ubiquinone/menaquinone biosynthesis C-methylase UbiE
MTQVPQVLTETLRGEENARLVEDQIWNVLPEDAEEAEYDSFGRSYERLVQFKPYTRLMWAADVADWTAYAQEAVDSAEDGPLLDVACGTLTFTAPAYTAARRPIVLLDRSLTMLQMARERLAQSGAGERAVLVVGDGLDLAFLDGAFNTVACHGALHHFEDVEGAVRELARCVAPGGQLYMTSLVDTGRWFARKYMEQMKRMGHFATIRTPDEVTDAVARATGAPLDVRIKGNMIYVRVDVGDRPA